MIAPGADQTFKPIWLANSLLLQTKYLNMHVQQGSRQKNNSSRLLTQKYNKKNKSSARIESEINKKAYMAYFASGSPHGGFSFLSAPYCLLRKNKWHRNMSTYSYTYHAFSLFFKCLLPLSSSGLLMILSHPFKKKKIVGVTKCGCHSWLE